jgi:hypothetical protein
MSRRPLHDYRVDFGYCFCSVTARSVGGAFRKGLRTLHRLLREQAIGKPREEADKILQRLPQPKSENDGTWKGVSISLS